MLQFCPCRNSHVRGILSARSAREEKVGGVTRPQAAFEPPHLSVDAPRAWRFFQLRS